MCPPFSNELELDDFLSQPQPRLVEMMSRLSGDLIILGVGGKMGVSLAQAAHRAAQQAGSTRNIWGVSRFTDAESRKRLERSGVRTITCDLLDTSQVARLPRAENVVFMAGRKFGTRNEEALTWATNVLAPATVAEQFGSSRIVAFSTGCVYPLVAPDTGGCTETRSPDPIGEYAQSCLGRERLLEFASRRRGTLACLLRLNYAIDLRYGVLHDLALQITAHQPVDLAMGQFNCIWQGDAINQALLALEHCTAPPTVLNLTGPQTLEVRAVAEQLAQALDRPVQFTGHPHGTAYLSNTDKAAELLGLPSVQPDQMIEWTAHWLRTGGRSLHHPTHFSVRNGQY